MTAPVRRLVVVDALRALAALLVLFGHTDLSAFHRTRWWPFVEPVWVNGGMGVGLFLVISGFSIHLRWAARTAEDGHVEPFPVARFWRRRFVRLYPTYWLALVVCIGVLVAARGPGILDRPRPYLWGGEQAIWVAVLTHVVVVAANLVPPTFIVRAWSLGLEEQLYAAYTVLMARVRRIDPIALLLATAALSVATQLGAQAVHPWVPLDRLTDGTAPTWQLGVLFQLPVRSFEWVLGFVAAEAWVGKLRLPAWTRHPAAAVALVGVATWFRFHSVGWTIGDGPTLYVSDALLVGLFGLGFFVLLRGLVANEARLLERRVPSAALRAAAWVGLFSYSLYLLHPPFLELVDRRLSLPRSIEVPVEWLLAIGASWLFFLAVERRFIVRARSGPAREGGAASKMSAERPELRLTASGGTDS